MNRVAFAALLFYCCPGTALADDADFCLLLNRVAAEQKLVDYSDDHIQIALCMAVNATLQSESRRDPATGQLCALSADYLTRELRRRLPDLNPAAVAAKCQRKDGFQQ